MKKAVYYNSLPKFTHSTKDDIIKTFRPAKMLCIITPNVLYDINNLQTEYFCIILLAIYFVFSRLMFIVNDFEFELQWVRPLVPVSEFGMGTHIFAYLYVPTKIVMVHVPKPFFDVQRN